MINGEEFDHHLDALTRRFQALRDQADGLPGAREALAPALQEMAQALAAARAAHEAEVGPARSETILRHVFEAIPDLITVGDENLNVIMSNWRDHEFVTPEERQGHPKCYRVFLHRDCPCEPCVVEEVFATGQPVKKEHLSQVDGQIREIHAFPIFDKSGRATMVAKHVRNITAFKQTEKALKDSEELYRVLTERSLAGVYLIQDGIFRYINPVVAQIFGYAPEEVIGRMSPRDTTHPDDLPLVDEQIRLRLTDEIEESHYTFRGLRRDGTVIHLECLGRRIDYQGRPAIIGTLLDITERQRLEEATEGYLQFIRLLLETIPNPIFYNDPHGMIQGCNKAFAAFAGVPQEEIPGRTVYDFFPGELARICDARDREALEHPETKVLMDLQVPAADGSQRQVVCHKAAFIESSGTIGGVVSIITDITDLQQAEAALKASEERYRLLAENVTEVLWMRNMDYVHTYVSPSVKNMTGYTAEEFISLGLRQIVLPAYHKIFGTSREKLLAPDAPPSLVYEVEYRRKDNSVGWAEVTVALMRDSHGLVKGLVGMARDITLRKRAEEALRESEARYRALFETSPHGTVLMDLQLNLTMANQRGLQLFGFDSLEDVKGENGLDFIAPEDLPQSLVQMQELLETGQTGPMTVDLLRKDGTRVPSLINASLVRDAAGDPKAIIGVAQDISALKQAEAVLATHLEFMRVLMDAIPNPVFYKDAQGAYLGCNKAFSDLMRVTREEIAGKTVYDLHPKELADKFFQMDLAVFQAPGSQVYETDLQAADGIMHQVIVHKATFPGADGKVAGLVGNIVDISDLKRAEEAVRESEARLRGIFEHAPVGIIMLDAAG